MYLIWQVATVRLRAPLAKRAELLECTCKYSYKHRHANCIKYWESAFFKQSKLELILFSGIYSTPIWPSRDQMECTNYTTQYDRAAFHCTIMSLSGSWKLQGADDLISMPSLKTHYCIVTFNWHTFFKENLYGKLKFI